VGKTVVSALLCAALNAVYWKPIQTGTREGTDRKTVMRVAGLPRSQTLPEAYRFAPPVSPHLAAKRAGVRIDLRKISIPKTTVGRPLIVEGAGGALVPINERQLMIDLMQQLGLPVVLVSRSSLGTINHTLLSLAALRAARLDVRGVVMVGKRNQENKQAIEHYGKVRVIGIVPPLKRMDRASLVEVFRGHFDPRAFRS
jgi:dethiobiotin synthase